MTGHPRLWLRAQDLDALRARAVPSNPVWQSGLRVVGEKAKAEMDAGGDPFDHPACGSYGMEPCEGYAELFAFLSLVDPDPARRADYAARARKLLMAVIALVEKKALPDSFSTNDRSRWSGEAFGLTVDWIYPVLSAEDKARIRKVFLAWSEEQLHAETTSLNHPEPIGVLDDPVLVADPVAVRFSGNNYYTAHLRNLGLMALCLDPADDPGGQLAGYLKSSTGAFLYVFDHLTRTDGRGGLLGEGFEYSPQTISYVAQLLWAMRTAGRNDPALYGKQVSREANPFWDDVPLALLHSLSPTAYPNKDVGMAYQPAWYGDGDALYQHDTISLLGPLGVDAAVAGDASRAQAMRWMAVNTAPGGAPELLDRVAKPTELRDAILYFLLLDPATPPAADPRPTLPTEHFADGLGILLARTDWSTDARWIGYRLGWQSVDHQHADGNDVSFFRKGEWLTKEQMGYGNSVPMYASDAHNTVAILNEGPTSHDDYRLELWKRGSQWLYVADGPGKVLAHSVTKDYAFAIGDATALYNSEYESFGSVHISDVTHASRSLVWLKPDHLVIYDRADTKTDGRFKRVFFHLAQKPSVDLASGVASSKTAGGQSVFLSVVLPALGTPGKGATLTVDLPDQPDLAYYDPMTYRTTTESTATSVRFLHVLQGADAGVARDATAAVQAGVHEGVRVHGTVVLFPKQLGAPPPASLSFDGGGASSFVVTGLAPSTGYAVTKTGGSVSVTLGGTTMSDAAGVVAF